MERIDVVLVQRGLAESRLQAKRLILAGAVRVDNISQLKPGKRIPPDAVIEVQQPTKYVSRGGLKLEKALQTFNIAVQDKVALDVGASTGGFTDCLLQHGACFVYAVDVGCEQLASESGHPSSVIGALCPQDCRENLVREVVSTAHRAFSNN